MLTMKNELVNYIVSSADWELEIDDLDEHSAAVSALVFAFNKFGDRLLLSTVIMVNPKPDHDLGIIQNSEFYASSEILKEVGLPQLSKSFVEFTRNVYETKYS